MLALDARWGEGKTWFVRHWQKYLENENHNVIYLDAFANDYLEDPFLVISSEITSCLSKDDNVDQSHINTFKEKAAAAYHALLPSLPKVLLTFGLNLISGGVLGTLAQQVHESGEKVIESATDELGDKIKECIEAKIESHEADKNTLQAFKQELAQLADELEKPLVFIIDELDRCRPDFAIRLIERIKHFFDIPKIVFVLVMNKPQLIQSVHSLYGYAEVTNGDYFEKFIDFTIKFPKLNRQNNYEMLLKEQLYRIGEILNKELLNEFYFWVLALQLYKNYNSRELIRKVNQYALLKTNDLNKNMLLIGIIFDSDFKDTVEYFRKILKQLLVYISDESVDRDNVQYVAVNLLRILKDEYQLSCTGIFHLANRLENIKKSYISVGQMDDREDALLQIYSKYSVATLDSSAELVSDWKNYIESGFFSETPKEN